MQNSRKSKHVVNSSKNKCSRSSFNEEEFLLLQILDAKPESVKSPKCFTLKYPSIGMIPFEASPTKTNLEIPSINVLKRQAKIVIEAPKLKRAAVCEVLIMKDAKTVKANQEKPACKRREVAVADDVIVKNEIIVLSSDEEADNNNYGEYNDLIIDEIVQLIYRYYKINELLAKINNNSLIESVIKLIKKDTIEIPENVTKKIKSICETFTEKFAEVSIIRDNAVLFLQYLFERFLRKYDEHEHQRMTQYKFNCLVREMTLEHHSHENNILATKIILAVDEINEWQINPSSFTADQLDTLIQQIEQYRQIVMNQRVLLKETFENHPEMYDKLMFYPECFQKLPQ